MKDDKTVRAVELVFDETVALFHRLRAAECLPLSCEKTDGIQKIDANHAQYLPELV